MRKDDNDNVRFKQIIDKMHKFLTIVLVPSNCSQNICGESGPSLPSRQRFDEALLEFRWAK